MPDTLNLVFPMAGFGNRFKGFSEKEKQLISLNSKPMFLHSVESALKHTANIKTRLIFVTRTESVELRQQIEKHIAALGEKPEFVTLESPTRGALETLAIAVEQLKLSGPLWSIDSDLQFFSEEVKELMQESLPKHPFLVSFHSNKDSYSYLREENGAVNEVREKEVISDRAIAGAYYFSDATELLERAKRIIARNQLDKGEFFISTLVQDMILSKVAIQHFLLEEYNSYGTPQEISQNNYTVEY